jgi:hypothetical protein
MDVLASMAIFLRHVDVPCVDVLISWRSSISTIFLSARSPLETPVTFLYYPSCFLTF